MQQIENELQSDFIPYEEAIQLKKFGFDKYCLAFYLNCLERGTNKEVNVFTLYSKPIHQSRVPDSMLNAPLYQQAFDFFLDKYGLDSSCLSTSYTIETKDELPKTFYSFKDINETRLECLRTLINLTNNINYEKF